MGQAMHVLLSPAHVCPAPQSHPASTEACLRDFWKAGSTSRGSASFDAAPPPPFLTTGEGKSPTPPLPVHPMPPSPVQAAWHMPAATSTAARASLCNPLRTLEADAPLRRMASLRRCSVGTDVTQGILRQDGRLVNKGNESVRLPGGESDEMGRNGNYGMWLSCATFCKPLWG